VSVARFIADQRTNYRVPHTITCLLLGVSLAWFYKWLDRPPTSRQQRRADVDAAVVAMFDDAKGLHGSPRLHADLRDAGWMITERTVADSMRRQGLIARKVKHRRGTTKQDRSAPKFPDLVKRDFTASAPNLKWCGDITEIPTGNGKLYLATVIDLYSRRLLAAADAAQVSGEGQAAEAILGDIELEGPGPDDVARVEINEAFASVAKNSTRMLGADEEIVNVNGGAVALGHPIGASGGRIVATMIHDLRRNGGGLGLAAICSGGGQGDALLIEA